jgi:thiamine transport system substrate-binding protein
MRRLVSFLVTVSVAAAALLAACGTDEPTPSGSGAGGGGPARVVLLTYDAYALPEEAAAAFTEATGATIEVRALGDAGSMLTAALLAAGSPDGDVIFGVDTSLATRVTAEPLLEAFTPVGVEALPADVRLPGELGGLLTPVDVGDVCINADAAWFAERNLPLPRTFDDLTDERYRDLLVVPSPVTSSPGLVFLAGTVEHGGATWPQYWESLRANGVRVRPSWDDAYFTDFTVSGGDRPLVVSYATSPPAEIVLGEGVTEPRSTVLVDTCVRQVEYAGVLRGAAEPELARELLSFMLSPEWQRALPLSNFVLPIVPGTPLPGEFERFAARPERVLAPSAERIGVDREAWIERWRSIME